MASRVISFSLTVLALILSSTTASPQNGNGRGGQPGWAARNLDTIQKIYNLTLYPNQLPILSGGGKAVPPGLFDIEKVRGRVSPVGNFTDFEDTIEYFFGLAPVPDPNNPRSIALTRAEIVAFQSSCPEVAASTVYLHTSFYNPNSTDHLKKLTSLKQIAFWRFNAQGAVIYYDAYIPNLSAWTSFASGQEVSNAAFRAASIQQLCGLIEDKCVGNNTQYQNAEDCVEFLSQRPYGEYSEAWGDNVVCRSIHSILTQIRPEIHCKHVGPTGGGKCVDASYNDKYLDDEALFLSPPGTTFVCDGKAK